MQLHRLNTEGVYTEAVRLCRSPNANDRHVGVDVLAQLGLPEHTFHETVMQVLLALLETEDAPEVLASVGVAAFVGAWQWEIDFDLTYTYGQPGSGMTASVY